MVLFDNITPANVIEVAAGASIQAAVQAAKPGTAIMVRGVHNENVKFDPSIPTTPAAPIWLIGVDGAKIIPTDKRPGRAAISGWNCSNYAVTGFDIEDAWRGIYCGARVSAKNVLVLGNRITKVVEDGIKISHIDNGQVIGNVVLHAGQEGIDFVAVEGGLIANNEVGFITGSAAGMFFKTGSIGIIVERNYVHDTTADGIAVGGQGSNTRFRPARRPKLLREEPVSTAFQAKDSVVRNCLVERVGEAAVILKGAVDCRVLNNSLAGTPGYFACIVIRDDDSIPDRGYPVLYSHNDEIASNSLSGNSRINAYAGNTNISIRDNKTVAAAVTPEMIAAFQAERKVLLSAT